jgi:hypothetical protein
MTATDLHIKLDFSLAEAREKGNIRRPTESEVDTIRGQFPDVLSIGRWDNFLMVTIKTLPPKPWPLTIAGASLFFCTREGYPPPTLLERMIGHASNIFQDTEAKGHITDSDFNRITAWFHEHSPGTVTSIRYTFRYFQCRVQKDNFNYWIVPRRIADLHVLYEDEDHAP